MKILSIGNFSAYGTSNTCSLRNACLHKLADVDEVDSTLTSNVLLHKIINRLFVRYNLNVHFPYRQLNKCIKSKIDSCQYDIVWIDKGVFVTAVTLKYIKAKSPSSLIVGYSPDNMIMRHNQSQNFLDCLPFYDYFITTKSFIVDDLKKLGVPKVLFVNKSYEDTFHQPYDLSSYEKSKLGGEIGFIGAWEKERCDSILYLAQKGLPIRVWGGGKWLDYNGLFPNLNIEKVGLFSEDYPKALSAFDISLCFLRKMNLDQQTARTMEIPACGSLLMAERTNEHMQLFEDGKEAVFFSSNEELYEKCKYYLDHPEERKKIAMAGHSRCKTSGYSNLETLRRVLNLIKEENNL